MSEHSVYHRTVEGDSMKNIQTKYSLLQIVYWITSCAVMGYTAIYLQYKGLTNTEIGVVTGASCVLTMFVSPFVASLPSKVKALTIHRLFEIVFIYMTVVFLAVSYINLPAVAVMVLYMALICSSVSVVPLLSAIAMHFISKGENINFGLSRGMGSVSYAASAVVLGQFVNIFDPNVISIIFSISAVLFLILLQTIPNIETEQARVQSGNEKSGLMDIVKKYKVFFIILFGNALVFAGASSLSTYLINIINDLGGSTTFYSAAVFVMAASELPPMMVTRKFMRRFGAMPMVIFAAVCYMIRNILVCIAPHIAVVLIGMMFQGTSYGILTSLMAYYVTDTFDRQDQMMGQSMIGVMTTGLGSMIGNVLGGVLQDNFGINSMYAFVIAVTITGAVIMIVAASQNMASKKKA